MLGSYVEHDHDVGHVHFIGVLEEVRDILRPAVQQSTSKKTLSDHEPVKVADKLCNLFEALELEQPVDEQYSASSSRPVQGRTKAQKEKAYIVETTPYDILVSSVFFFRDLNEFGIHLRELWTGYRKGEVDLTAASLITNTAIELIERNTEEQLSTLRWITRILLWMSGPGLRGYIARYVLVVTSILNIVSYQTTRSILKHMILPNMFAGIPSVRLRGGRQI